MKHGRRYEWMSLFDTTSCDRCDNLTQFLVGSMAGTVFACCFVSEINKVANMAEMKVTVWNVENGNSISVELPNGRLAMIDAHATANFSPIRRLHQENPERGVYWLFVTHPHTDHLGDLPTIKELKMGPHILIRPKDIDEELIKEGNPDKEIVEQYLALDKKYTCKPDDHEKYSDSRNTGGVDIKVFIPESRDTKDLNDYSRVVLLSYGGCKVLCMGDCTPTSVKGLLKDKSFVNAIKGVEILVAPHHGHESCYCPELFEVINPALTIISDNHADDGVSAVPKYEKHCRGVIFTDEQGQAKRRYCLTTRNDGDISIRVTEKGGLVNCSHRQN